MPQIVKENGLLELIDRDTHLFGEASPNDIIHFEFDYKKPESTIEYIETSCPCTKVWYENGKIKGTLDLSKVVKGGIYTPGSTSVGKNFSVYLNDGVNRYTSGANKQRQAHPLKKWFQVLITGVVVV